MNYPGTIADPLAHVTWALQFPGDESSYKWRELTLKNALSFKVKLRVTDDAAEEMFD